MTRPSELLSRCLVAALLTLLAAPRLVADEVEPDDEPVIAPAPEPAAPMPEPAAEPTPEPEPEVALATEDDVVPAPAPTEGWRLFTKGTHRITLFGGLMTGQTARDAGILASPVTGQPGSLDYPAESPLRVELEDAPTYGLRWSYHPHAEQRWGIELGVQRTSSEIVDPESFDRADVTRRIMESSVPAARQAALVDRLERNRGPYDIDLTFFDVGMVFIANPNSRWPAELNAGLGWVTASLDGSPAVFERLVTSTEFFGSITQVANESEELLPGRCQADNDPCIEEEEGDGLTWYVGGGISYAFTEHVMLRMNARLRLIEQILDPGDTFVNGEGTLGLAFAFGGE